MYNCILRERESNSGLLEQAAELVLDKLMMMCDTTTINSWSVCVRCVGVCVFVRRGEFLFVSESVR